MSLPGAIVPHRGSDSVQACQPQAILRTSNFSPSMFFARIRPDTTRWPAKQTVPSPITQSSWRSPLAGHGLGAPLILFGHEHVEPHAQRCLSRFKVEHIYDVTACSSPATTRLQIIACACLRGTTGSLLRPTSVRRHGLTRKQVAYSTCPDMSDLDSAGSGVSYVYASLGSTIDDQRT